jgi:hemin uptake protein HemP
MNAQTDFAITTRFGQLTEAAIPVHDATELTAGGAQARIVLHGMVYALRITRAGKLILTK